jgi:hypothetical protein
MGGYEDIETEDVVFTTNRGKMSWIVEFSNVLKKAVARGFVRVVVMSKTR